VVTPTTSPRRVLAARAPAGPRGRLFQRNRQLRGALVSRGHADSSVWQTDEWRAAMV